MKTEFTAVVLAAGKGNRMNTSTPKVLLPLAQKPLLKHVLDNLYNAGCRQCVVIVGYCHKEVQSFVEQETKIPKTVFAYQKTQLGTGHALLCAKSALSTFTPSPYPFLVTSGDMPLLSSHSFQTLISKHKKEANTLTVLAANIEKPKGYGRLLVNDAGKLERIIEEKDASFEQKKIRLVNTGSYIFQYPDIFLSLEKIGKENAQNEYYLPDVISLAEKCREKKGFYSLINANDAYGANSPKELKHLESLFYAKSENGYNKKEIIVQGKKCQGTPRHYP